MDDYTVGDLSRLLDGLPSNTKLSIAGGLRVSRLQRIDDDVVFLEFVELEAELSPAFRRKHPTIVVAFCRFPLSGEVVQEVLVPVL